MCICMCVCMYMCIYVYIYVYVYICICMRLLLYFFTYFGSTEGDSLIPTWTWYSFLVSGIRTLPCALPPSSYLLGGFSLSKSSRLNLAFLVFAPLCLRYSPQSLKLDPLMVPFGLAGQVSSSIQDDP